MKLKLDTLVDINLPALSGRGKIKGISAEMPVAGVVYIVEVIDGGGKLPNEAYPYTHVVVPEAYLVVAAVRRDVTTDKATLCVVKKRVCYLCGEEDVVVGSGCPKKCPECGVFSCPRCGGKIDTSEGGNEDVLQCGGACTQCGWEHCGDCV